jgi:uncharacterized RmlC-like cupin family protein
MTIQISSGHDRDDVSATAALRREGFWAAVRVYDAARTEPHSHGQDLCLYILDGEFRLGDVEGGKVHCCGPGDRIFVAAGTHHYEDHGEVRIAVGRREVATMT